MTVAPALDFHADLNGQYSKVLSPFTADGRNMNTIIDKHFMTVNDGVITAGSTIIPEASDFSASTSTPSVTLGPPEKNNFYDSDDDSLSSHCEAVTTVLYDMFPDLLTAKEKTPTLAFLSSTGDDPTPFPPLLAAAAAALSSEKSLTASSSGVGGRHGENGGAGGGKVTKPRKPRAPRHRSTTASAFSRPNVKLNVSVKEDDVKCTLVRYSEGKAAMMLKQEQREKDFGATTRPLTGNVGNQSGNKKARRPSIKRTGSDHKYGGVSISGNQDYQIPQDRNHSGTSTTAGSVSNSEDEGGGGGGGSGGDKNASALKRPKILATISDSKENDDICIPADELILPVKADDKLLDLNRNSTSSQKGALIRSELHEISKFPVRLFNAFNTGDMKMVYSVLDENLVQDCLLRTSSVDRVLVGREYVKKMFHSMTVTHPDFVYLLRDARMIRAADGTRAIAVKLYFSGTRLDTRPSFNDEIFRKPGLNVAETLLDMSKMSPEEIEAAKQVGENNRTQGSPYRIFGKVWYRYRLNDENKITEVFCVVTLKSLTEAKGMAVIATGSSGGDVMMPST
jgi:hypothetical protein